MKAKIEIDGQKATTKVEANFVMTELFGTEYRLQGTSYGIWEINVPIDEGETFGAGEAYEQEFDVSDDESITLSVIFV